MIRLLTVAAVFIAAWFTLVPRRNLPHPACTALSTSRTHERRCVSMNRVCIDNHTLVIDATHHAPNAHIDLSLKLSTATLHFTSRYSNITGIPAFCRVKLEITTNDVTGKHAQAELWLPDRWNGRLLALGQDGLGLLGAALPYGAMAFDGIKQAYAVYSPVPESFETIQKLEKSDPLRDTIKDDIVIDAAWRSLHATTVAVKTLTKSYYGRRHTKSYFSGCGGGGRQGIKAMATFPDDYDGVVLGSPANPLGRLIPWKMMQYRFVESLDWLDTRNIYWYRRDHETAHYKARMRVRDEALKQCDADDGLVDGIISNPDLCRFRPEVLVCRPHPDRDPNQPFCLGLPTLKKLQRLYSPSPAGKDYIIPGRIPGGEYAFDRDFRWRNPPDMSESWALLAHYRYFVTNETEQYEEEWDEEWEMNAKEAYDRDEKKAEERFGWTNEQWEAFSQQRELEKDRPLVDDATIELGIDVNPGQADTYSPDLTAFFRRGGKVIQYAGWDDEEIHPEESIKWYRDVFAWTTRNTNLDINDHFRLFMVPGMKHCSGGQGAWMFGGHGQRSFESRPDDYLHVSCVFDTSKPEPVFRSLHHLADFANSTPYDVQAAMVDWVENGKAVDYLVAIKYNISRNELSADFASTRKLCPYPQRAIYLGSQPDSHASFQCV